MTVPQWCLFIAALLPLVLSLVGAAFRHRQFGGIDNNHPRLQQARMEGIGARAMAAQQNAWEALAVFTPAVLIAHLNGATAGQAALAAMIFVAARTAHPIFYLANIGVMRSASWAIGLACCLWLFFLAV